MESVGVHLAPPPDELAAVAEEVEVENGGGDDGDAVKLSKMLARRSGNAVRKITVLRVVTADPGEGMARGDDPPPRGERGTRYLELHAPRLRGGRHDATAAQVGSAFGGGGGGGSGHQGGPLLPARVGDEPRLDARQDPVPAGQEGTRRDEAQGAAHAGAERGPGRGRR